MKLHFGHGVFFFAALFAGFVIYLVTQMVSQRVDLVEKDYYEKGLEYQKVINNTKNERAGFICVQDKESFIVQKLEQMPAESCVLVLYRPSDSRLDTTFLIPLTESSGMADLAGLEKGLWRYTLSYQVGEEWYYQKDDLFWK